MKYIVLLLFFLVGCSQLPTKRTDKLSILQGVTNSKEVEFSVMAAKGRNLRFELRSAEGEILEPVEVKTVSRDFSDLVVHKVLFTREQIKDFNLYVYDGVRIVDQRLVGKGQRESSKLRLAVVSNANLFYSQYFNAWTTLAQTNPEYLVIAGNNVFTDLDSKTTTESTDPETIWKKYADHRLTIPLYFQEKLIPTHAVWSDRDYGVQNGNETFPYKKESKEIFDAFYAQDISEDDWTKSFGVGGLLSIGDFNLYFLDARTSRSKHADGSHLGVEQSAWFISKLREEKAPSLLIKGDQFFGDHEKESFESSHPNDFRRFVDELKKIDTPYVFLSGGENLSEIMQFPRSLFGKPSFEITSAPVHGPVPLREEKKNPWRVVANTEFPNFTIIENEAKDNHWFMDVENIGVSGETYYKRELAVYIKDLQDNLKETRKRRSGQRRYRRVRGRR